MMMFMKVFKFAWTVTYANGIDCHQDLKRASAKACARQSDDRGPGSLADQRMNVPQHLQ